MPIKPVIEKKKPNELLCKLEPKQFKFIKNELLPFLERLRVFIIAATRNKNWVEKELNQSDLEAQLNFRDYVVFPQRDTIVIINKIRVLRFFFLLPLSTFLYLRQTSTQKKFTHKSLSLTVSLDKCAVFIWGGDEVEPDFNKVLLGTPLLPLPRHNALL